VRQILSQDHTGFGVWLGDPFHDKESEQFVARYIERAPLSLEKPSIQDDIVTYTTKDGAAHEFFLLWSFWQRFRVMYRRPTSQSQGITDGIFLGAEGTAKLAPSSDEETESDYRREFRRSAWAACIKRVYEIDPVEIMRNAAFRDLAPLCTLYFNS
jgi:hypothetical protein